MDTRLFTDEQGSVVRSTFGMVIVSDIRFLRESLAEIFREERGPRVLGTCGELHAVAMCAKFSPEIVLLDVSLPGAIRAVGKIRAALPMSRVVAMALTETVETVVAWAEAGVDGYLPNTAALADLDALLADILRGAQACSARVVPGLLRRIAQGAASAHSAAREARAGLALTPREQQIVGMIGAGMSNKDIARQLDIGLATTKSHVHNLLAKLNIQRRGQAAAWMREHGSF